MRPLLLLLGCAAAALAGEPQADPSSLHLPREIFLAVRFAPPQRLDAMGGDLEPLLRRIGVEGPLGRAVVQGVRGARALPIDRSKPFYFALGAGGTRWIFQDEQGLPLPLGEAGAGPARCTPLAFLPGDVSLCVPVAELVERHRAKLEEAVAKLGELDDFARRRGIPVSPTTTKLLSLIGGRVLGALGDVETIQYALTWRDGRLVSEGWVRTKEGSDLAAWLARTSAGAAPPGKLIDFLPHPAFWMVESGGLAARLDADVTRLLDDAYGPGSGRALLALLSPSYALHEQLNGRAAGVVVVQGLMAMSMQSVHELKADAKMSEAIAALDADRLNELLQDLGGGLAVTLERNYAEWKGTKIHRVTFRSAQPQLFAFTSMMQTCFAVEGKYLLVVQSSVAESDLRSLIDRVRGGSRVAHARHAEAMQRLMPDRHEGLSINAGALKPILAMTAMAAPRAAPYIEKLPDELYFSTALAVRDGHIHFRGDWPLGEIAAYCARLPR